MSELNETLNNAKELLSTVLIYVVPFILVLITLFSYSKVVDKIKENTTKIVESVNNFLSVFNTKKVKLSLLILTIVYIVLDVLYLIYLR